MMVMQLMNHTTATIPESPLAKFANPIKNNNREVFIRIGSISIIIGTFQRFNPKKRYCLLQARLRGDPSESAR